MKTVYADAVFAVNTCIDYILLYISVRFLHIKVKTIRLLSASVIGGCYAVVSCVISMNVYIRMLTLVLSLLAMLYTVIGKRSVKTYIKTGLLVYSFSFLLGGCLTFVFQELKVKGVGGAVLVVITVLFACFVRRFGGIFNRELYVKFVEAEIKSGENCVKAVLLCDSGNLLVDPYTGNSVILLDSSMTECFDGCMTKPVVFSTAGGTGTMRVFTPDCVSLEQNKKIEASVGFVDGLDKKEYNGIISTMLIENL